MPLHVLRHDDGSIGPARYCPREHAQQPASRDIPAILPDDPLEIVTPESHDQRYPLGQGSKAALAELRMHQIVGAISEPPVHLSPGRGVVRQAPACAKGKEIHLDPLATQEFRLACHEHGRPAPAVPQPVAGDHQHADLLRHATTPPRQAMGPLLT
jgi:hypothetical protein